MADEPSGLTRPTLNISLEGQTAIVTGASSGIGHATAVMLAAAGAKVVVNYPPFGKSQEAAESVVAEISDSGGTAVAISADVSKEDQVDKMVEDTVAHFGGLHIMVCNAGIERPAAIGEMTLEQWRAVIDVNLTGGFLCSRAAARVFLKNKPDPSVSHAAGKIVFTSSVHEFIPWAYETNYAASKGGVMLFMKSLAQELAPAGIRVNSIAPGAIRTDINRHAWETEEARMKLLELIPYGRVGLPDDVARGILWLVSDAADYVTGTTLVMDGGMSLYPSFRGAG
jgi:glucose 1-dehydrogenase